MDELGREKLKREIEDARARLDRAVEEKRNIRAAYEESLELDRLIEEYVQNEKRSEGSISL